MLRTSQRSATLTAPFIDQIGYHCRDYFLKQGSRFAGIPRSVIAHSTHLKGQGTYDATTGIETPRINVTLATSIPEERCRRLNLGYIDPKVIRMEDWKNREGRGRQIYSPGRRDSIPPEKCPRSKEIGQINS